MRLIWPLLLFLALAPRISHAAAIGSQVASEEKPPVPAQTSEPPPSTAPRAVPNPPPSPSPEKLVSPPATTSKGIETPVAKTTTPIPTTSAPESTASSAERTTSNESKEASQSQQTSADSSQKRTKSSAPSSRSSSASDDSSSTENPDSSSKTRASSSSSSSSSSKSSSSSSSRSTISSSPSPQNSTASATSTGLTTTTDCRKTITSPSPTKCSKNEPLFRDCEILMNVNLTKFVSGEFEEIFKKAEELNVSPASLVRYRQDTEVCMVLLGPGNADLSGIGSMTGYWLQLSFMSLGVALRLLPPLIRHFKAHPTTLSLSRFHTALTAAPALELWSQNFTTAVWFAFGVSMGGYIQITKAQVSYDLRFMLLLALFQLNSLTASAMSLIEDRKHVKRSLPWLAGLVWLLLVFLIVVMRQENWIFKGRPIKEMNALCQARKRGIPDFGWNILVGLAAPLALVVWVVGMVGRRWVWSGEGKVPGWVRRRSLWGLRTVEMAAFAASVYQVTELAKFRGRMKSEMSKNFKDDEWGFGQVLAVMAWAPLTWAILEMGFELKKVKAWAEKVKEKVTGKKDTGKEAENDDSLATNRDDDSAANTSGYEGQAKCYN